MKTEILERPKTTSLDALPAYAKPYFNVDPEAYNGKRKTAEAALARLPFIGLDKLQRHQAPLVTLADVQIPVERIVSSQRPFNNWAAKGSSKRLQDDRVVSSIERAEYFAGTRGYNNPDSRIIVQLFEDNAGEVWGSVVDGTHRVMAAKLLGEESLRVELQLPADPAQIDHYDGDIVREVASATA
jgi:hypothetical protein